MKRVRLRPAFTLVELLVAISILAILGGLTAAAYFRVVQSVEKKNNETMIRELDSSYLKAIDKVNKESAKEEIPANIQAFAGGDPQRTRVIYQKLRLRQEFPMNFYEALDSTYLPAKPAYVAKLSKAGINTTNAYGNQPPDDWESSICLTMALEESRGGVTAELGTLGSSFYRDCPKFPQLKALVDPYGEPIFFYRWATDHPDYAPTKVNADDSDPDGTLAESGWVTTTGYGPTFNTYLHRVASGKTFDHRHVILSKGKDKKLGVTVVNRANANPMSTSGKDFNDNVLSNRARK